MTCKQFLYGREAIEVRGDFQTQFLRMGCVAFAGCLFVVRFAPMDKLILATDRLWLREIVPTDVDDLLLIWADPEAMRWYPKTLDRDEMLALMERNQKRYEQYGHGLWGVILPSENNFIGDSGLVWQDVDGVDE